LIYRGNNDDEKAIQEFYGRADQTAENLIQIRSLWDNFLVPSGAGGSRIPHQFVKAGLPSSDQWAQFQVRIPKKKRKLPG